jgi:hypothetical protein
MSTRLKPGSVLVGQVKLRPAATTFKTSLRAWQACYQAQLGTPASGLRKIASHSVRG